MTEERLARIDKVARKRQPDLTIVLENVHDPHNIGAVLRTCDSVGIHDVYILNNDPTLVKNPVIIGKNTSTGARKWLNIQVYNDTEKCFKALRKRYGRIYGTHLGSESKSLYTLDLKGPAALVFGNEHAGITEQSLKHLDTNFIIPQVGMVQSLNISVACAVTLYEAFRQREVSRAYSENTEYDDFYQNVRETLIKRHESGYKGRAHEVED
jgi:tRNA (guanosine-2'-O-)-methyltransferase